MNRLFAPAAPPTATTLKAPSGQKRRVDAGRVRKPADTGPSFSHFAPQHYEANYAYPLVIWLHSAGGDERQLADVMPLISKRNYVGLGVRGLGVRGPVAGQRRGFAWPQTADGIVAAEQRVIEAIGKAKERFNVHSSRVFLAGYEAGGTMAYRLALRNPNRFAAAVSLGGAFPEGERPLANLTQLRKFPLFAAHCRDSQNHPIDRICQELRLIHSAGMCVTLRQYPCGDDLTTQMLHDLDVWLMEQVTGVPTADQPDATQAPSEWN
jgi:phospholipase/carboxylesterase